MTLSEQQRSAIARMEVVSHEMANVLRAKSERERLEICLSMWRSARDLIRNCLRGEHPEWSDDEVCREAARRLASGRD
jgi:hypothetical protein